MALRFVLDDLIIDQLVRHGLRLPIPDQRIDFRLLDRYAVHFGDDLRWSWLGQDIAFGDIAKSSGSLGNDEEGDEVYHVLLYDV